MSAPEKQLPYTSVNQARFERLQAIQAQGPDYMRMLAKTAWAAIDYEHQNRLIGEAVSIFGSDHEKRQDAYINTLLITEYLSDKADHDHLFHPENHAIVTRPNVFNVSDGGVSDLPPVA